MEEYESVLCVKSEVFVYRIPARTSNRGYRFVARLCLFVGFINVTRFTRNSSHFKNRDALIKLVAATRS